MEHILEVLPLEKELRELKELLAGKDVKDTGEGGGRIAALEKKLGELTSSPPMATTRRVRHSRVNCWTVLDKSRL